MVPKYRFQGLGPLDVGIDQYDIIRFRIPGVPGRAPVDAPSGGVGSDTFPNIVEFPGRPGGDPVQDPQLVAVPGTGPPLVPESFDERGDHPSILGIDQGAFDFHPPEFKVVTPQGNPGIQLPQKEYCIVCEVHPVK